MKNKAKKTTGKSKTTKTASVKKAAAKKKAAPKKTAVKKKAAPKKTTVKKKAAPKKAAAKKKAAPVKKPAAKPEVKKVSVKKKKVKGLTAKESKEFKVMLLDMLERLAGQRNALREESLKRNDSIVSEEDGTDAFERQFALMLASSEDESINAINEALQQIAERKYGICLSCECLIERARLRALPFATMCVKCKSEEEKKRNGIRTLNNF